MSTGTLLNQTHYLGVTQAAETLGVSVSLMNKWRVYGQGPAYHKIGRRVIYGMSDLHAWLASRKFTSTSAYTE